LTERYETQPSARSPEAIGGRSGPGATESEQHRQLRLAGVVIGPRDSLGGERAEIVALDLGGAAILRPATLSI
jgi:hypothetical protein